MKDLEQFVGIYPVSKTLRFELKPVLQNGRLWMIFGTAILTDPKMKYLTSCTKMTRKGTMIIQS